MYDWLCVDSFTVNELARPILFTVTSISAIPVSCKLFLTLTCYLLLFACPMLCIAAFDRIICRVRCPTHFCVCVHALWRSHFLTDFDKIWHRRLEPKSRTKMPTWPLKKNSRKGGVVGVTWPLIFLALNANSSKMAKVANLKFGTHDPR